MATFGVVLIVLALLGVVYIGTIAWQKKQKEKEELRKQLERQERRRQRKIEDEKRPSKVIISGEVPSKVRRGRRSVVLLVDDSPTMLLKLRKVLELWEYKVITAKDGREAWGELQKVKPDLLVSDIEMPNLNGLELVKLMRSDLTLMSVPVVLITGNVEQYLKAGQMVEIEGLLQKPFEDKILIDQIRYILQE